jgi:peptidoglycan hydrolase CwlO-like protein
MILIVAAACGGGKATSAKLAELESKNQELSVQIAKLDADLKETQRQLNQQKLAMQAINDRLKIVEVGMDKLAYGAAR